MNSTLNISTATRDASFHNLTDLGEKQAAVLAVIAGRGPLFNRAIAEALGWDVNRVTPRVFELRERGLVVGAGVTFDAETGRNVTLWATCYDETVPLHRNDFNRPGLPPILSAGMASTPSNDATPTKTPKTALEASQALSGDVNQKQEMTLGQRLLIADKAARDAGLTGFWIELYRLVATATTPAELAYASKVIAGYKVSNPEKYPQYQTIRALGEQRKKELAR